MSRARCGCCGRPSLSAILGLFGVMVFNRRFTFALAAVTTLLAKGVHIYAHYGSFKEGIMTRWSMTFFLQDVILLTVLHLFIAHPDVRSGGRMIRALIGLVGTLLVSTSIFVGLSNICVFYNSGVEVHWANAALASDASGRATLLSGLWSSIYITCGCVVSAMIFQWPLYFIFECAANLVIWLVMGLAGLFRGIVYLGRLGPRQLFRRNTWREWYAATMRRVRHSSSKSKSDVETGPDRSSNEYQDDDSSEDYELEPKSSYTSLDQDDSNRDDPSQDVSKEASTNADDDAPLDDPTSPSDEETDALMGGGSGSTSPSKPSKAKQRKWRTCLARVHPRNWPWVLLFKLVSHAAVLAGALAMIILTILRPTKATLQLMTWTAVAAPFVGLGATSESLAKMTPLYGTGIGFKWDRKTAVGIPAPKYDWLPPPSNHTPPGFEDWYDKKRRHYSAKLDPLKISNMHDAVLDALGDLKQVPIRHVMTIFLESTRKDVFPITRNSKTVQRLAESWDDKQLPRDVEEKLGGLTPTARYITGTFEDGFADVRPQADRERARGGMTFEDVYSTSTYTLKSLTGTLCGLIPLIVDFNSEWQRHFYQPCLPHVLDVLSTVDHGHGHNESEGSFLSYPWKSTYMQAAVQTFDEQVKLTPRFGFGQILDKAYLQSDEAKFGKVTLGDVNYFSIPEDPLLEYIKDEFNMAKENNGRVLITHLTSTSHHPYGIPASDKEDEKYKELGKGVDDLSKWVNAIGYDDRWLNKIMVTLDELGVANETLVVLVGDHGLSLPENGKPATYYNPNTINNIVPMVFSHPLLPPIKVDSPVTSRDVLPTILDLLVETDSLSTGATRATKDLLANYEGQSMIRPIRTENERGVSNWHFTIVNPGGEQMTVRDAHAQHKHWVVTVPVGDATDVQWQFSADDHSEKVVFQLDFHDFLRKVESEFGLDAAHWAEEAAFIGRWWAEENKRRWRHGRYQKLP